MRFLLKLFIETLKGLSILSLMILFVSIRVGGVILIVLLKVVMGFQNSCWMLNSSICSEKIVLSMWLLTGIKWEVQTDKLR